MTHTLRRARVLVLCGPLALGLLVTAPGAHAQDAPAAPLPDAGVQAIAPTDTTAIDATAADTTPAAASATAWTTLRGDAQRTSASSAQVSLPLSLGWRYTGTNPATTTSASPIILDSPNGQRVYFAMGKQVMCLDAQTGAPASGFNSPALTSSMIAPLTLLSTDDGDFIIAGTLGGTVNAFRASDGGRAWEVKVPGSVSSGGPIVVKTANGVRVVVATDTGQVVAITPQGQLDAKWKSSLGRYSNPPSSALALSENGSTLYAIANDGKMYYIDAKQGTLLKSITLANSTIVNPVVAGKLVVTTGISRIAAFDAGGGAPTWSVKPNGTVTAAPAFRVVDGVPTLFYGTTEGTFFAIDARDGSQKWKATPKVSFTGAPVVLPNMVLAGTRSGSMVAFNPKSGAVLWQYRLKTERVSNTTGRGNGDFGGGRGGGRGGFGGFGRGASFDPGNTGTGDATFQDVQRGFGGGGGGFGGGRRGNQTLQYTQPYSITAAPSVVNGQIFVQGNDSAVYGFTSQSIDADPPRVVEPSISVPDSQGNLTAILVNGNRRAAVPGVGPFYFAAQLDDVGSGVDPDSIRVTVDGVALDEKRVDFDFASGVLTLTLLDPAKNDVTFQDGLKTIAISMKDYAGNIFSNDYTFDVENDLPAPTANQNNRGGGRGFGNRGGGDPNTPDGNGNGDDNGGPNIGGGPGGPDDGGGRPGGGDGPDDGGGRPGGPDDGGDGPDDGGGRPGGPDDGGGGPGGPNGPDDGDGGGGPQTGNHQTKTPQN